LQDLEPTDWHLIGVQIGGEKKVSCYEAAGMNCFMPGKPNKQIRGIMP